MSKNRIALCLLVVGLGVYFWAAQRLATPVYASQSSIPANDARIKKAYRFSQDGWTYVHLEGKPYDIGQLKAAIESIQ